jgi:hypothetical protein
MANNKLIGLGSAALVVAAIGGIAYLASTQNKQEEQFDRTPSSITQEISEENALRDSIISEYLDVVDSLGRKYNWDLPSIDRRITANPNLIKLEKEAVLYSPNLDLFVRTEIHRKGDSIRSNEMYRNLMKPRSTPVSSGAPGD